jgi:DNA gyrase subunit A
MVVTISHGQYAKRLPTDTYRKQGRGGRGVAGAALKDEDWVEHLFVANTHQYLLFFTSTGRCHWLKVHQLPQAGRNAKGKALVNLLQLEKGESVRATVPVPGGFDSDKYVVFATESGLVKRTSLDQFSNIRRAGIRAIEIMEGDQLIHAELTEGRHHVLLAARLGKSIRFVETDVRPMGRTARGVKGIELSSPEDRVVGMMVVDPELEAETSVLSVTENGYGKRTDLAEYRPQGRGGKGIITMNITERNGPLVGIQVSHENEELMVITRKGIVIRMAQDSISSMGRNTQGVKLINLDEEDAVATVAPIVSSDEIDAEEESGA